MKKFTYFAALMAAALVSFNACQKDDPKKPNRDDDDDDNPAFVSPIAIDGNFADWDALDASKVAVATTQPGAKFDALKSVKVYADQLYINILIEFDGAQIADRAWVPFHVYLDADNKTTTGGYGDEFSDACVDFMLETAIFNEGNFNNYNPSFWKWWGGVNESGWLWSDPAIVGDESNFWGALIGEGQAAIGSGSGSGNKYEIQLMREMMTGAVFADTFGIGFDIQQNWSSCGILPNLPMTDDNPNGLAPMLKVTIDK